MIPTAANIPTISRASVDTNILSNTMVVESLGGLPPEKKKLILWLIAEINYIYVITITIHGGRIFIGYLLGREVIFENFRDKICMCIWQVMKLRNFVDI